MLAKWERCRLQTYNEQVRFLYIAQWDYSLVVEHSVVCGNVGVRFSVVPHGLY